MPIILMGNNTKAIARLCNAFGTDYPLESLHLSVKIKHAFDFTTMNSELLFMKNLYKTFILDSFN